MTSTYDQDVIKWSEEQAKHLLAANFAQLDLANLAEEILDVGRSELIELENRMTILLMHLIMCAYQPQRHSRSWDNTISEQRKRIARALKKMPSLKFKMDEEFWHAVWDYARLQADSETGINKDIFPETMPWATTDVLMDNWYPDIETN